VSPETVYQYALAQGLEHRVALEIASVVADIRPRALIQTNAKNKTILSSILKELGIRISFSREMTMVQAEGTLDYTLFEPDNCEQEQNSTSLEIWIESPSNPYKTNLTLPPKDTWLGYPDCCIKAYNEITSIRDCYNNYSLSSPKFNWTINKFSGMFSDFCPFLDFFPCNLQCEKAIELVHPLVELAARCMPKQNFNSMVSTMKTPLLLTKECLFSLTGATHAKGTLSALADKTQKVGWPHSAASGESVTQLILPDDWPEISAVNLSSSNNEMVTIEIPYC
jgi:hypothetical protein